MLSWLQKILSVSLVIALSGCAQTPSRADQTIQRGLLGELTVHSTSPTQGAKGVCLDHQFKVLFNDKIDAYSAVADNFEIWSVNGNRVGGDKLVSTRFVPHPDDSERLVSEVSISLQNEFLFPFQEYFLMWGEPRTDDDSIDPNSLGIQNLLGFRATSGAVRFSTDNCLQDMNSQEFEVISMSPGRILTRGRIFDISAEVSNLLNRNRNNSFITFQKDARIRITFNQPLDRIDGVDSASGPLGEINNVPISQFPSLAVFVLDANTRFDQLYFSLMNLDQNAWESFRNSYINRFNGSVSTTNGRRTLLFQLPPGEAYPDTLAQAIFVVGRDLRALNAPSSNNQLKDNLFVGGFMHFSGFGTSSPIKFLYDQLGNNSSGGDN